MAERQRQEHVPPLPTSKGRNKKSDGEKQSKNKELYRVREKTMINIGASCQRWRSCRICEDFSAGQSQTERDREETRMEKVFLSIIAASGLSAVSSQVHRQYYFVYDQKNMTEAQKYCREKYTDLATIDNMEDVKILNNTVDKSRLVDSEYGQFAWIRLYDDLDSWRWSLPDTRIYKDEENEFRRWSPEEPNNQHGGEHCAEMYDNGLWNDVGCDKHFKAVCMDVRGPNVTFVPTKENMTWTEAQSYCRQHHTDLARVTNMAENQKCLSSIKELAPEGKHFWIGLFRDSWKWSDGSNSSFRIWRQTPREPNNRHGKEICVAANFNNTGEWEDWNCHLKRAFICYGVSVSKQVVKVRLLKKSSSLDLDDPAVMEHILKQLKQRLEDQGVSEGIRLSWRKQSDGKVFHEEEEMKKKTRPEEEEL